MLVGKKIKILWSETVKQIIFIAPPSRSLLKKLRYSGRKIKELQRFSRLETPQMLVRHFASNRQ